MIISTEFYFAAAHRLLDYPGACKNIHGHNYKVVIAIESPRLDHLGMLIDFKELKAIAMREVMYKYDHKLILNAQDTAFEFLMGMTDCLIMPCNPTAENMALDIYDSLRLVFGPNIKVRRVQVWETATSYAEVENG